MSELLTPLTNDEFVVSLERAELARDRRTLEWDRARLKRWERRLADWEAFLKQWASALILLGVLEAGGLIWILSVCNERLRELPK